MKKTILSLIILLFSLSLKGHPWKPAHYLIIDTDGGIDDLGTISMMLASPDIRVLAIISSPGTLDTENCYLKIKSLLDSSYHEGIPVGINRSASARDQNDPASLASKWGDGTGLNSKIAPDHLLLLKEILAIEKNPVSFISLGGNSTVSSAIESIPTFKEQVKEIDIKQFSALMLSGKTVAKNQVIKDIPLYPAFYFDDIEPYVTEIIEKHGEDEWISGVLANELHRHLGVFAIIGVKMGIRAREYFNIGVDEFSVTTYAGSIPPLSCMNDGIQVSTGATVGHGLIAVRTDTLTFPAAEFTYMNRKIRLTLASDIATKISAELKEINFVYGLDSDIYWELVRKNSIKYWRELDRHDIFKIEVLN